MPASADGFPFLLAAGTAVIAVKPLASAGSGSGHAGAARGTNGKPREERRTIHDPWWGHLRIVAGKSCVDLFQKLKADDRGNFNLHDGGRVVQAASSGVSAPIGPFASRVITASENTVERTDGESCRSE